MKALWQNIQGVRRVVLETSAVSIVALIAYLVTFWVSGKVEVAVVAFVAAAIIFAATAVNFPEAAAFTVAFVAADAVAIATAAGVAFVAAFAVGAGGDFPTTASFAAFFAFAFAAIAFTAAFVAAMVTAKEYRVGYWKVLVIFLVEALALFGAMKFAVPHLALGVLSFAAMAAAFLLAESKLRLWLKANRPPLP